MRRQYDTILCHLSRAKFCVNLLMRLRCACSGIARAFLSCPVFCRKRSFLVHLVTAVYCAIRSMSGRVVGGSFACNCNVAWIHDRFGKSGLISIPRKLSSLDRSILITNKVRVAKRKKERKSSSISSSIPDLFFAMKLHLEKLDRWNTRRKKHTTNGLTMPRFLQSVPTAGTADQSLFSSAAELPRSMCGSPDSRVDLPSAMPHTK